MLLKHNTTLHGKALISRIRRHHHGSKNSTTHINEDVVDDGDIGARMEESGGEWEGGKNIIKMV